MTMRRLLVSTTGTGKGSEIPIIRSVEHLKPDKVILLVTNESMRRVEDNGLVNEFKTMGIAYDLYEIRDAENIDLIFKDCIKLIEKLEEEEKDEFEVYINYTSGTKSLSVGICLAGLLRNYFTYCYVGGKVRDESGRVKEAEEVTIYKTWYVREAILKRDLAVLMNRFNYKGALDLLSSTNLLERMEAVKNTIDFLSYWDAFNHLKAAELITSKRSFMREVEERRNRYAGALNKICSEKKEKPSVGVYTLVDLLLNAKRRMEEGKYDDAVARIYRAMEMTFQILLWEELGISTSDVDTEMEIFSPSQKDILRKWKGDAKNLQIGLRKAAEVYSWHHPEVRDIFNDMEVHLSKRNLSILAHGSNPVSKESAEDFMEFFERKILPLVDRCCKENVEKIANNLRFPDFKEIS